MNADISTLKRSFAAVGEQGIVRRPNSLNHDECDRTFVTSKRPQGHQSISSPIKRRSISIPRSPSMPIQTTPLVSGAFPSFMSVFVSRGSELNEDMRDCDIIDPIIKNGSHSHERTTSIKNEPRKAPYSVSNVYSSRLPTTSTNTVFRRTQYSLPTVCQHKRTTSVSSDSTDSSPTTTVSTFDSPSITDPSPSSSPESPNSALPLSPFKVMMKSPVESDPAQGDATMRPTAPFSSLDPARLEASGSRNVKNLSLTVSSSTPARPATSSGIESSQSFATPLSPLKGPLRTGRRKPTNLSIQTPGVEKTTFLSLASDIPPTPSQRPSLQRFPTSPVLPSLLSPITGPPGGMMLSTPSLDRINSRSSSQWGHSHQSINSRSLHDPREDDHHRPPKSQETQERGYPNGPVQVYDSGVFLYLEPNREEASKFDTVINVAKEIKNPFAGPQDNGSDTVMSLWRGENDNSFISEPQTAVSEMSFKSAFEWPQTTANISPTTPKAGYRQGRTKEPEYIHVRWDHNSELVDDLLPLCQIIDNRTSVGKTVLVHCQLGVSRSASLVLAYGLYKGYQPDFHAMYGAVKERSQWISPNMSLIYQLMDFRTRVEKGHFTGVVREPPPEWFVSHKAEPPLDSVSEPITPVAPFKPSMKSSSTQTDEPFIRRRPDPKLMKALPPVPLFPKDDVVENTTSKDFAMADTISSADSTRRVFPVPAGSNTAANRSSNGAVVRRPLPLREHSAPLSQSFHIPPHRSTPFNRLGLSITRTKPQMDLAMQDVPESPSLFSPRQAEFMATPFSKTVAGDLAVNGKPRNLKPLSNQRATSSTATVDPRSPHRRSEAGEILRSIDEVL